MNNPSPYTIGDVSLWVSFKSGDAHAFETIYERHIDILTNYGLRIRRDKEFIKDAIHDMFVDLWRNRNSLGSTSAIKYYLIKALRRNLLKKIVLLRKRQGEDITQLSPDSLFEFSHELILMKAELDIEKVERLQQALKKLSSRQKEVLFLRYYGGFSPDEISQLLEINPQSVYNLIHRGLDTLRENMKYTAISSLVLLLTKYS
jgi:RNA polymerase sigma factor (sigma-70 family)